MMEMAESYLFHFGHFSAIKIYARALRRYVRRRLNRDSDDPNYDVLLYSFR